ncbi:uncharacterized protein LOC9644828 isoform X2 [Selaginella moellendorffii]|uniref:uncharacterized protein LOC9644828 isoform X2 n=1 Tax=Selaginella moellendorffii TaxID=88036 RepID=UPI000D1C2BAE|nr:uncharacterized protein LOC9644828 isoform X2 [Selaginella moellendorffii]|eukprot:XP_024521396.1 uncharacterized protein LOC9644828 isoform X2 [Selaginella moellendorffii]
MPARDMFDYRGYCSVRSKRSSDGGQAQCRGVRCSSRKIEECWQRVWIALMALTSSKEIKRGDMNKLYELWDAASKQQSFYLVISLRDARFDGVLPASSPSVVRVVWGKTLLRQFRLIMTGGNCSCGALDWRRVFGLPLVCMFHFSFVYFLWVGAIVYSVEVGRYRETKRARRGTEALVVHF